MLFVMGIMIEGQWRDGVGFEDVLSELGSFERPRSSIRHWITPDGAPGPTGDGGFAAEAGRYHLYVMEGCPWAHRSWLMWTLKELAPVVSMSRLLPRPGARGWSFDSSSARYRDPIADRDALYQVYAAGAEAYSGRVTVPVLYDKKSGRIVSNESADILRMFNSAFDALTGNCEDFYPEPLRDEIDALNARIYRGLNNGVYRAGFAQTREAHLAAKREVFDTLDQLERRLEGHDWLVGERLTEADLRCFPTLVRFDAAYYSAFRCNERRLVDYPNLWRYARRLYALPGVAQTVVDPVQYRRGYHSIPIAIGHRDPVPTDPIPSLA